MCLFCDIIQKRLDADIVFEDNEVIAVRDIHPKAPIHILILPKRHIESVKKIENADKDLLFKIMDGANKIAAEKSLAGYKLVFNVGQEGGQTIDHLHLHLLGGWKEKPNKIEV